MGRRRCRCRWFARLFDKFPGTRFINAFGQTETASTITMLPPDDHNLSRNG